MDCFFVVRIDAFNTKTVLSLRTNTTLSVSLGPGISHLAIITNRFPSTKTHFHKTFNNMFGSYRQKQKKISFEGNKKMRDFDGF